jgi:hypothetical protein
MAESMSEPASLREDRRVRATGVSSAKMTMAGSEVTIISARMLASVPFNTLTGVIVTRRIAAVRPYSGPPATLGSTATAGARLVVWCRACGHRVEPGDRLRADGDTAVRAAGEKLIRSQIDF